MKSYVVNFDIHNFDGHNVFKAIISAKVPNCALGGKLPSKAVCCVPAGFGKATKNIFDNICSNSLALLGNSMYQNAI